MQTVIDSERDLRSVSTLCQLWRVTPRQVTDAASAVGAHPVFKLDGRAYFGGDDCERIAARLREGG